MTDTTKDLVSADERIGEPLEVLQGLKDRLAFIETRLGDLLYRATCLEAKARKDHVAGQVDALTTRVQMVADLANLDLPDHEHDADPGTPEAAVEALSTTLRLVRAMADEALGWVTA